MKIKDIKNFPKAKEIIGQPDRMVEAIKYGYNLVLKEVGELEVPELKDTDIKLAILSSLVYIPLEEADIIARNTDRLVEAIIDARKQRRGNE